MTSNDAHSSVAHPVLKLLSVWAAAFGISTWSDLAAFLAALYSLILIGEWAWKKCGRPFAERRGWLKRRARRASDQR